MSFTIVGTEREKQKRIIASEFSDKTTLKIAYFKPRKKYSFKSIHILKMYFWTYVITVY